MTGIGAPHRRVAYALVQASWESSNPSRQRRYLEAALSHYKLSLANAYEEPESWVEDQLLAGELERRLRQFEQACARFTALLSDAPTSNERQVRIARYQLKLVDPRDSEPRRVPTGVPEDPAAHAS